MLNDQHIDRKDSRNPAKPQASLSGRRGAGQHVVVAVLRSGAAGATMVFSFRAYASGHANTAVSRLIRPRGVPPKRNMTLRRGESAKKEEGGAHAETNPQVQRGLQRELVAIIPGSLKMFPDLLR